MTTKAITLVKIRDTLEEQLCLIKAVTEDRGTLYVLRHWHLELGMKIALVEELVLQKHETAILLSTLLDEVEEWRRTV